MQPEQQQRIMGYFIEEAKDHLGTIEQGLLNLQGTMEDPEMVNEVFRAAHSVKGGAAMLGLDSIQRTAHRLEDSFKILKDSPLVIDDKLETLFLRVKDILQDLLENLQGPLGLTEEIAGNIMSGVDPIFEELNNHLEFLVHGKEVTSTGTSKKTKIKVPVSLNKKAIQQTFQKDVVVRLREMLQQFKQPDSPERRQQLQADCEYLANLGTQYNLTTWGDLLEIGKVAIATPTNPYRQLASVIIKEIKQAQELVLAGQVDEIVPSDTLKALAPDWSLLLGHPPSTHLETPQTELRETIPQLTVVPQLDAYQPQTAAFPTPTRRKMDARETTASSDPHGPEVGTAELNSLADLFEGEAPDLDQTWQEEEILTTAVNTGGSPSTPASDLFDRSDFSDLLGDMNTTTTPSNDEDLMGLFGDDAPTLSPTDTQSTTGSDDFSDLLFEAESSTPETSAELTDLFGDDFFEEDSSEDVLVRSSNNGAVSEDEWLDSLDSESLSSLADLETTSDTLRDDSLNDLFSLEEEAPTSSASDSFLELNDLQSLFPNETVIQADDDWMGFDTQEYVIEDEEISANLNGDVLDVQSSQSDWEDLFGEEGLEAPEENLSLVNADDLDVNARQDTLFFEESEAEPSNDLLSFDLEEVPEATSDLDLFSVESSEAIIPTSSNLPSDFDTSIDDFNEALFDTDESAETETNLNNAENLQALFGTEESLDLSGSSLGDRTEAFEWDLTPTSSETSEELDLTSEVNAEAFEWDLTPTSSESEELEELNLTPEVTGEAFNWETPSPEISELEDFNLTPEVNAEGFDWDLTPTSSESELEELNLTPEVNAEAFDWETAAPETSELEEFELSPEVNAEAFEWDLTPISSDAEELEEFELSPEVAAETSELEELDLTPEVNAEAFEWDLSPISSESELEEFELSPEVNAEAFEWDLSPSSSDTELEELDLSPEVNAEAFDWDLSPTSSESELEELNLSPEVNAEAFEWDLNPDSSDAESLEEFNLNSDVTGEALEWETALPETSELEELNLSPEVNAEAFEWDLGEIEEPTSDRLLDLAAEELSPEAAVNLENLLEEHQSDRSLLQQELSADDPLLDFALEEGVLAGTDEDDLDNFFLSDSSTQTELSEMPDLELDALLDEPADEPDLIAVDELDNLQDEEDLAFDALGDMDFGNLLDEPATNSEFDDLDSLLQPMSVSNEFDDLDAMLGDMEDSTPVGASNYQEEALLSIPDAVSSTDLIDDDLDNEFGDLEKLLEQADQTMGGQPTVKSAPGSNRPTSRPRQTRVFEQTMRVPVKQLDNLNNLMGELVVNRNTLEQDQERLRQFLDNLLNQVQQLSDVGSRMQDLYERSLLESSLLASRQGYQSPLPGFSASADTHSSGAKFDVLEMDRFTGFHLLSQEMIELIVRVRESASDITFLVDETDQVARMLRQVTTQLQEGLTRSRMVPFAQTADRLPRAVREISVKLRKSAELYIEGRETLIDKMILEHLYDPMTHLVNNAITHGIETPEERLAAGKPPTGRITIRTFHQGNQTIISVSDDGAGINPERVKAKAIEKGLLDAEEAKNLSRIEVYDLLFHAGFSTKDQADDYSGRGVGMDVVRTSISEIRGTVTIDSTLGKGTTFTIRLPLTLSICKALCCLSDRTRIAFPMDGVEEMNDIPNSRIQTNDEGQTCFQWRDTLMPFQPLNELLTYNRPLSRGNLYGGKRDDDAISIIVLRSAGNFIAVQVDQVLGEREIVIKQLEGPVPKPVGVAGATVLGDGHIMPIADVLELIDISTGRIRKDNGGDLWKSATPNLPQEAIPVKTEPMVLIVDDSITVRELLSMTFNKSGYRVEQARDGQEAWEKLRSGLPCDLVFCDIEMPRMDGLELLSRLQKDENLCNLPIAMLTSRGADRHRQLASQLGASGYFTKPYLEEMLLDAAQRMIKGEDLLNGGSHS